MKKDEVNIIISIMLTIAIIAIIMLAVNGRGGEAFPADNGTITLCFSKTDNCTAKLYDLLAQAGSIKAALYDLDEKSLIAILKEKNADVLVDEDNYAGYGQKIMSPGLMHDKFWLLYNSSGKDYVVTGSTNPTYNDLNKNDNNMMIIDSHFLFQNYEDEFFELEQGRKDNPTRYKKIILNSSIIENYFCPDDGCEDKVLATLRDAKESVYFMIFSFTSDPIGNYLIAMKDKLDIKGVFDESQVSSQKQYTEYYKMLDAGMDVRLDGNPAKLHHKVLIIDNSTIITGSYNPTSAGTGKNDENIIIIHDLNVANAFIIEFKRICALGDNKPN
jgi:hypothetical protein